MPGPDMPATLTPILRKIAQHLSRLEQTLAREYAALSENDLDTIVRAAEEKIRLFGLIEELEQARHAALQQAGVDPDDTDAASWLQRNPALGETLVSDWQQVRELTRKCHHQNRINGIILEKTRRRTEQALSILKGQTPQPGTYTARGETERGTTRHSLAKA